MYYNLTTLQMTSNSQCTHFIANLLKNNVQATHITMPDMTCVNIVWTSGIELDYFGSMVVVSVSISTVTPYL